MKLILKSGKTVDYPRSPRDITLAQYIVWHNEIRPTIPNEVIEYDKLVNQLQEVNADLEKYYKKSGTSTPDELKQYVAAGHGNNALKRFVPELLDKWYGIIEEMEKLWMIQDSMWIAREWHPFQLRVVQALTGIDDDLTVDELQYLFRKCTDALLTPKNITYKQIYEHQGVVYTLPDKLMSKSTLIEFAEAAQYEAALKQSNNGDANGLLKMCAVLLRPSGEKEYSEEVFERNCEAFQTLPLITAYEISFFLTWLSGKYMLNFNRSTLEATAKQIRS